MKVIQNFIFDPLFFKAFSHEIATLNTIKITFPKRKGLFSMLQEMIQLRQFKVKLGKSVT